MKEVMLHMGLLDSLMSQISSLERVPVALSSLHPGTAERPGSKLCLLGHITG